MKMHRQKYWILLALLLIVSSLLTACQNTSLSQERPQQTAGDKALSFASEKDKDAWRKPLEKLLANARDIGEEDPTYKNLPTYGRGFECALFDVTSDGVPELIVNYGGGTAGNHVYHAFDLYTGETVGWFEADGEDKWQAYYDVSADEIVLMGTYRLREGWDLSHAYFSRLQYDEARGGYLEYACFQVDTVYLDVSATESKCRYYVEGREVSEAEYDEAFSAFEKNLVLLEGTGLTFVDWADGEDYKEIARKTADALLSTEQKFPLPDEAK